MNSDGNTFWFPEFHMKSNRSEGFLTGDRFGLGTLREYGKFL